MSNDLMEMFNELFLGNKPKTDEVKARHRIIKETYPDGRERFSIEEYSSWLSDTEFWHAIYLSDGRPNTFKTQQEASDYLTEMLAPPVVPTVTVVEER